jgi:hypothetical protein
VTLVIDVDAVLSLGPFETASRSAPRAQKIARGVEHEYRGCCGLTGFERARPVQDVDIVLRIDADARCIAEAPLVRHFGPRRIHFEYGHLRGAAVRNIRRGRGAAGYEERD